MRRNSWMNRGASIVPVMSACLPAVLAAVLLLATPIPASACTTIIVGKDASATGSCLLAHNENDEIVDCTVVEAVPAATPVPGSVFGLFYGGTVPLPPKTEGYIATAVYDKSLIPGRMNGIINDHQVSIVNNWAPGVYEPKGTNVILWSELTELAGLQAKTAREAVQIIGDLVEEHGVKWGGTMFGVADPNEAWWVEICGKQWVARRVGDDKAEVRANCYRISAVNFKNPARFMWSPDVRTYAQHRHWYKPSDGPFNWAKVYGLAGIIPRVDNVVRQKMAARYLAADQAVGKITKKQLMKILRSHFEGSQYYNRVNRPYTICNKANIASFVAELRGSLPSGIGGVLWTCLSEPCANGFVPWYEGVTRVPGEYSVGAYRYVPGSAYWACRRASAWTDRGARARWVRVGRIWRSFERAEFSEQAAIEATALETYSSDPAQAWEYLTAYSGARGHEAYVKADGLAP